VHTVGEVDKTLLPEVVKHQFVPKKSRVNMDFGLIWFEEGRTYHVIQWLEDGFSIL
jgi:hypothetical protein